MIIAMITMIMAKYHLNTKFKLKHFKLDFKLELELKLVEAVQ